MCQNYMILKLQHSRNRCLPNPCSRSLLSLRVAYKLGLSSLELGQDCEFAPAHSSYVSFNLTVARRFAGLGITNTIAVFQSYISTHQLADYSESSIGWIFSLYTFLAFFCGIYIGPIFDKYGPRWLIAAGVVCVVAAQMLFSICTGKRVWVPNFRVVTNSLQNTGTSSWCLECSMGLAAPSYSRHVSPQ